MTEDQSVWTVLELSHPGYDDEVENVGDKGGSSESRDTDSPIVIAGERHLHYTFGRSVCVVSHGSMLICKMKRYLMDNLIAASTSIVSTLFALLAIWRQ